jgi:uncharacterized protein YbjT (DUF2867 family)
MPRCGTGALARCRRAQRPRLAPLEDDAALCDQPGLVDLLEGVEVAQHGAAQIVYLGGLGEAADLSPHLRSRAETATILKAGPVPVTTLQAAMIVGAGSVAFETILALVDRLPIMICPRWVSVETQPVAMADVLAVLVGVCGGCATPRRGTPRPDHRTRRSNLGPRRGPTHKL